LEEGNEASLGIGSFTFGCYVLDDRYHPGSEGTTIGQRYRTAGTF